MHQQKTEDAKQEARSGVKGHVPPPESGVVVADFAQKQGREHKADGGQLQFRWNVDAETSLKQNREKGNGNDHAGQKGGEPALTNYGKYGLGQEYQLQGNGDSLVGNSNAHAQEVPDFVTLTLSHYAGFQAPRVGCRSPDWFRITGRSFSGRPHR